MFQRQESADTLSAVGRPGLPEDSVALLEQIKTIDKSTIIQTAMYVENVPSKKSVVTMPLVRK